MSNSSAEEHMLRAVAYYHPIDHGQLRRVMADWYDVVDLETFKRIRSTLTDLGLITHPKIDEHYYITEEGWRQLGGETPLETDETWSTVLY